MHRGPDRRVAARSLPAKPRPRSRPSRRARGSAGRRASASRRRVRGRPPGAGRGGVVAGAGPGGLAGATGAVVLELRGSLSPPSRARPTLLDTPLRRPPGGAAAAVARFVLEAEPDE